MRIKVKIKMIDVKGLVVLNQQTVIEAIENLSTSNILDFPPTIIENLGIESEGQEHDEALMIGILLSGMVATGTCHGIFAYGKIYLGPSKEDLIPELENLDFNDKGVLYLAVDDISKLMA